VSWSVTIAAMAPGFAGIGNDLHQVPNTTMLFGDAKQVVGALVNDLPEGR
jgi:NAD/NADP transhydrogenase beta subunit